MQILYFTYDIITSYSRRRPQVWRHNKIKIWKLTSQTPPPHLGLCKHKGFVKRLYKGSTTALKRSRETPNNALFEVSGKEGKLAPEGIFIFWTFISKVNVLLCWSNVLCIIQVMHVLWSIYFFPQWALFGSFFGLWKTIFEQFANSLGKLQKARTISFGRLN